MTCRYCGDLIENRAETGRPPTYCKVACRRAAEYEIRRASRRLESLEDTADDLERRHPSINNPYQREVNEQQLAVTREQIERARLRLRDLLEDTEQ